MAWELLAGEHPFASRTTVQAMVVAQLAEPAPSLRAQQPVVPDVLETVVMQCLAKAPDQRPASAAALLAALDSTGTSGERVVPRVSRRPRARGFAVAAVIVLAAAALWLGRGMFASRKIARHPAIPLRERRYHERVSR